MRDGFIFYKSFYDALKTLPDDSRLKLYDAISGYSLTGEEPILSGVENTIFILIKPQIEANNKRYENGRKGATHGAKGGRPKNPKITPKEPQNNPKITPKEKEKEKEKVNVKEYILPPDGVSVFTKKKGGTLVKPDNVTQEVWENFVAHRKQKKAPITDLVISRIKQEATKANWELNDALVEIVTRNWQGFNHDWVKPKKRNHSTDWTKEYDFGK